MPYLIGDVTKTKILKSESHKLFHEFEVGALKSTLTVSTALITGNSTVVTINGTALTAVAWVTDGPATMALLVLAIAANALVASATLSDTLVITVVPVDKDVALVLSAVTTGGASQPTWAAANDTNTVKKGQMVQLQADGTIEPVINGDFRYKSIGVAFHNGLGGELVTVMMKAFAIIFMEAATDALLAGPVTIHANGQNATTGYLEVDDASVTTANMVGWALDSGDDGDVIRVAVAP